MQSLCTFLLMQLHMKLSVMMDEFMMYVGCIGNPLMKSQFSEYCTSLFFKPKEHNNNITSSKSLMVDTHLCYYSRLSYISHRGDIRNLHTSKLLFSIYSTNFLFSKYNLWFDNITKSPMAPMVEYEQILRTTTTTKKTDEAITITQKTIKHGAWCQMEHTTMIKKLNDWYQIKHTTNNKKKLPPWPQRWQFLQLKTKAASNKKYLLITTLFFNQKGNNGRLTDSNQYWGIPIKEEKTNCTSLTTTEKEE